MPLIDISFSRCQNAPHTEFYLSFNTIHTLYFLAFDFQRFSIYADATFKTYISGRKYILPLHFSREGLFFITA